MIWFEGINNEDNNMSIELSSVYKYGSIDYVL